MALKEYTWLTARLLAALCATTMFPSNTPKDVTAACELCNLPCGPSGCGKFDCDPVDKENKEGWTDCKVTDNGKTCGGDTTCKWSSA